MMIGSLHQMLTCRWAARRIQRYVDADPSAPLTPGTVARLEAHLATCEKCTGLVNENRALHWSLSRWSGGVVDPEAVERLHGFLDELEQSET